MSSTQIKFNTIKTSFFFTLIILLSIGLLFIFKPFFYPIFWAAVIAVLFHPIFKRINKSIKLPALSSIITVVLVVVFLIFPLAILGILLINESLSLYERLTSQNLLSEFQQATYWLEKTPLQPYIETIKTEWTSYAANISKNIAIFLFNNIRGITQNSVTFFIMFFLTLYTLYYFLKDGEKILKKIMYLSPLDDKYEIDLYEKFHSTSKATLKGTLIIGGIQGTIGGITFWITGVESALMWGVVMIILAIIPAVGPFLIWFPAGIIMLATGHIWQGVTILITGSVIISLIDNLLRPTLVGKDAQLHPLIVLFSTLGGLIVFGISGFVIGPVIAALFLSIMTIYKKYYKKELKTNN